MTDAQDETTARRGEHWSSAALAHPHSVPTMDLNLAFLSVRDDAKLWERHKGEKNKVRPTFSEFASRSVFHQKKIEQTCGTVEYLEFESQLHSLLHDLEHQ